MKIPRDRLLFKTLLLLLLLLLDITYYNNLTKISSISIRIVPVLNFWVVFFILYFNIIIFNNSMDKYTFHKIILRY